MAAQSIRYTALTMWSPLQEATVWMGAWLYGLEPADELLRALGPSTAPDFPVFMDFLSHVRTHCAPVLGNAAGPALRLILSAPGSPPLLPAGGAAAEEALRNPFGAIAARGKEHHLIIFVRSPGEWVAIPEHRPLPAPAWLSPGEADAMLAQATNEAADLIEASGFKADPLHNPRLLVGRLEDFHEAPGMPSCTPVRATRLFARADRVAAIVEAVTEWVGDRRFDPQLLRLTRHVNLARMTGVAYCLNEFARGA